MQLLEHIHVNVDSLAEAERFVQAALPRFVRRGGEETSSYGPWVHFGTQDSYIAFTERKGAKAMSDLRHIGMVVEDVDELIARLGAAGFEPSDSSTLNEHPHRRRVYYIDGNGLDWEFVQYLCDEPGKRNDYSH